MSNSKEIITVRPIFRPRTRPNIENIPSPKCQTLLYQSAMQHLRGIEHFATFALVSETFRNSSFGANLLMHFIVDRESFPLFNNILTPQKCLSLQFTHSLKMNQLCDNEGASSFATEMMNTKYLRRQLRTLSLDYVDLSITSCFFNGSSSSSPSSSLNREFPRLLTLRLRSGDVSDDHLAIVAANCPSLSSLDLQHCRNVTDTGLDRICSSLKSSITHLDLLECESITDVGLTHISRLTSLNFLDLSWCSEITDAGLQSVFASVPSITSLNLQYCQKITDDGFTQITENGHRCIAKNLAALTFLNVRECNFVTDVGVEYIAAQCKALKTLDVAWTRLTDGGLEFLSNLPSLTSLDIEGCDAVTDSGIWYISQIRSLKFLNLTWCGQITNAGLQHIASSLSSLTTLNLKRCSAVTDAGLLHLMSKLQSTLTSICLLGCDAISDEAKQQFVRANPNCTLED